jgi:hypothetical protein
MQDAQKIVRLQHQQKRQPVEKAETGLARERERTVFDNRFGVRHGASVQSSAQRRPASHLESWLAHTMAGLRPFHPAASMRER